jgi:ribosomal protein S12 methylthiotransferase accessory factor
LCPVLSGRCVVRGAFLSCFGLSSKIDIKASPRYLRAVVNWCDGQKSLEDLSDLARLKFGDSNFLGFLEKLLDIGVLIDANLSLVAAYDAAQAPARLGKYSTKSKWEGARFNLAQHASQGDILVHRPDEVKVTILAKRRRSAEIFGEPAISEQELSNLLESLYSFANLTNVNETSSRVVASAGRFYPLRFYLVLLREVGVYKCGVYYIYYGYDLRVYLRPIDSDQIQLYRAVIQPYHLLNASGAIVSAADIRASSIKYRNKGLHYAVLEAGSAMQNGALAATEISLGWRLIGGFYAGKLQNICGNTHHKPLAMAVFGSQATELKNPECPELVIDWADNLSSAGLNIARATFTDEELKDMVGWGRSHNPREACAMAISEAVERYSYKRCLAKCNLSTASQLTKYLNPDDVVKYSFEQYQSPHLGVSPFSVDKEILWTTCKLYGSNQIFNVPVELVYGNSALPDNYRKNPLARMSSSGCASDVDIDIAIQRAAYELIERDAFVRHWLAQVGGQSILVESLPSSLLLRIKFLTEQGCAVSVQALTRGIGPVILVMIVSHKHGFCVLGSATGQDAESSIDQAFKEAEVLANVRLLVNTQREKSKIHFLDVITTKDHTDLFAQRRFFKKSLVLLPSNTDATTVEALNFKWPKCITSRLNNSDKARKLYWSDLTVDAAPKSLDGGKINTVRALIPGTIPVAFGYGRIPLGMGVKVLKGGLFPHPMS